MVASQKYCLIIFDDTLQSNKQLVDFITEKDNHSIFKIATAQSSIAKVIFKKNSLLELNKQFIILIDNNEIFTEYDAIVKIFQLLRYKPNRVKLIKLLPSKMRLKLFGLIFNKHINKAVNTPMRSLF